MAHVAGAIKEANYKYVVLDLDMDKNLVDEINNYDYIMFGMRAGNALNLVLDKIEEIKTNTPEKTIIIGGPLVMAMPGKVLKDTKADYLIHGDAEEAVINLLVALENKSDLSKIKGVGYKKNGVVFVNEPALIQDLDTLPFPDIDSFDVKKYLELIHSNNFVDGRHFMWYSSRGCTSHCQFCFHDVNFRGQSAKKVVADLKLLKEKYGITALFFYDDNFLNDMERAKEFCNLVKPLNIQWGCEARVTSMREDILTAMKESGCTTIRNGIESGSDRILKVMHKGATVKTHKKSSNFTNKNRLSNQRRFHVWSSN